MKTIWKYRIAISDTFSLTMPEGAKPLHVALQNREDETLTLWALVDTERADSRRTFRLAGTGHPIDETELQRLTYIGTALMYDGRLVYHLFEFDQPL